MKPIITKSIHAGRTLLCIGIFAAGLFPAFGADPASGLSLTQFVNPFIGTEPSPGSQFGIAFDTGNVFPGAVAPRGMLVWSPDTTHANKISSGYWYPDQAIEGFSLTHLRARSFTELLAVEGSREITTGNDKLTLSEYDRIVVPHGMDALEITAKNRVVLLECLPLSAATI